jgi:hypothetical protein
MSKMGSHDPFRHLQHKLWPKERSGVKLIIWLPTTRSRELTWFPCVQVACNTSLESSQRGLQLWFNPCPDRRFTQEVLQSCKTLNLGDFETPIWESRDKKPLGCHSHGVVQSILYEGRWWLPLSPGHGESCESCESKVTRDSSSHQRCSNLMLTNLFVDFVQVYFSEWIACQSS